MSCLECDVGRTVAWNGKRCARTRGHTMSMISPRLCLLAATDRLPGVESNCSETCESRMCPSRHALSGTVGCANARQPQGLSVSRPPSRPLLPPPHISHHDDATRLHPSGLATPAACSAALLGTSPPSAGPLGGALVLNRVNSLRTAPPPRVCKHGMNNDLTP